MHLGATTGTTTRITSLSGCSCGGSRSTSATGTAATPSLRRGSGRAGIGRGLRSGAGGEENTHQRDYRHDHH